MTPSDIHRDVARVAGQMSVSIVRQRVDPAVIQYWIDTLRWAALGLENYLIKIKNTT